MQSDELHFEAGRVDRLIERECECFGSKVERVILENGIRSVVHIALDAHSRVGANCNRPIVPAQVIAATVIAAAVIAATDCN